MNQSLRTFTRRCGPLALLLGSLALTGCATKRRMSDAPASAFLQSSGADTSHKLPRLPFDHAWVAPGVDTSQYTNIVIRPVTLEHLRSEQWKESLSTQITSKESFDRHAAILATHWNKTLHRSFRSPANHLKLSSTPGPRTLILETALTEIVFGHPETYAGSFAVPFGGVAESAMFSPTVAFEARITDATTGKLLATASDRRGTRLKLIDFNRLTITKPNKEICDEWSEQFMQALNKEMFPKVKLKRFSAF